VLQGQLVLLVPPDLQGLKVRREIKDHRDRPALPVQQAPLVLLARQGQLGHKVRQGQLGHKG
jgi:hypothetical protein